MYQLEGVRVSIRGCPITAALILLLPSRVHAFAAVQIHIFTASYRDGRVKAVRDYPDVWSIRKFIAGLGGIVP